MHAKQRIRAGPSSPTNLRPPLGHHSRTLAQAMVVGPPVAIGQPRWGKPTAVFVPYRKFAATETWFTAGPLVHRALDEHSHDSLDPRIIDAEREGAPLVFGWLRYGDGGVDVIADPAPGTPADFSSWLDPLLDRWSTAERVVLTGYRRGGGWTPGT